MNSTLRNRVMSRIYVEYAKNLIAEKPDYFMFLIFMMVSFTLISFRHVLENLPKESIIEAFNFFVFALKNTDMVIKLLLGGFVLRLILSGSAWAYHFVQSRPQLLPKMMFADSDSQNG